MKTFTTTFALALALLLTISGRAYSESPYSMADETWVSIDGTVDSVSADTFALDYGSGVITVEMDDGDRDADAYKLVKGDKVRVSGRIDDDLFETTTIEASSVYVENLGTYFFASSIDEEDTYPFVYTNPVVVGDTTIQGTVTKIDGEEEFVLNTGLRLIRVEVDEMSYNPLDDEGYQQVKVGDRVRVYGDVDVDLFELEGQREFVADSLVTLSK